DFLDETIQTLSERIEELTRPFSREIELLDTIPGVDKRAAEMLLAEIGPDMSRFPTEHHLASWAGCAPASVNPVARSTPPRLAKAPNGCAER
ncbi:MAG: transposase, partial [Gemmatimonadaceae bacterium]